MKRASSIQKVKSKTINKRHIYRRPRSPRNTSSYLIQAQEERRQMAETTDKYEFGVAGDCCWDTTDPAFGLDFIFNLDCAPKVEEELQVCFTLDFFREDRNMQ